MKNRKMILVVSLLLALTVSLTGTMAYLSDTDEDVNVMTLGNVQIEQHEMKRKEGIAYDAALKEGDLVPFTDGIKLYPAYPVNGAGTDYSAAMDDAKLLKWGPYVHTGTAANGLWDGSKLVGAVDKMVFVENTGNSPAYFRTLIAYECPDGVTIGEAGEGADIMINENGSNTTYNAITDRYVGDIVVEGVQYAVLEYIYQDALLPGEWSHPSLLQVVMTHNADNETVKLLGETYDILVLSQAVQVENLEQLGAQGALDAAFGDVTATNAAKWFSGMEALLPVATASTADELAAALAEGGTVVLTDDIELTEQITIAKDTTLVLGDKTIKANPTAVNATYGMFNIPAGKTLTVEGNGNVKLNAVLTKDVSAVIFQNDGNLIINGGNYLASCTESPAASIIAVVDNCAGGAGSSVTINGGTFAVSGSRCPNIIRNWPLSAGSNVSLTINGGTFKANPDREKTYIWSKNDTAYNKEPAGRSYVTINGGTFEDIKLEVDGFVDDHYIDSSVTGIEMVEGGFNGYVNANGEAI